VGILTHLRLDCFQVGAAMALSGTSVRLAQLPRCQVGASTAVHEAIVKVKATIEVIEPHFLLQVRPTDVDVSIAVSVVHWYSHPVSDLVS